MIYWSIVVIREKCLREVSVLLLFFFLLKIDTYSILGMDLNWDMLWLVTPIPQYSIYIYISGQWALNAWCLPCWSILNWFMGRLGRLTCTAHLISAQDQPGRKQMYYNIKKLRPYCPDIYTVSSLSNTLGFSYLVTYKQWV